MLLIFTLLTILTVTNELNFVYSEMSVSLCLFWEISVLLSIQFAHKEEITEKNIEFYRCRLLRGNKNHDKLVSIAHTEKAVWTDFADIISVNNIDYTWLMLTSFIPDTTALLIFLFISLLSWTYSIDWLRFNSFGLGKLSVYLFRVLQANLCLFISSHEDLSREHLKTLKH